MDFRIYFLSTLFAWKIRNITNDRLLHMSCLELYHLGR